MVTFSATPFNGGTTPSYQWKLNGVNVGTNSPSYINSSLTNGSTVTVIMTSNDICLTTTTAVSTPILITVNSAPTLTSAIVGNTVVCSNVSASYSVNPVLGATSYNWTFPAGWIGSGSSNINNATSSSSGGIISLYATNICGSSSTKTLAVSISTPTVSISGSFTICAGNSSTLSAIGSGITSYTWNTGATTSSISVSPASTSVYSVVATNTLGCTANFSRTLTVNPLPLISLTSATLCAGETTTLVASGASTFTWNTSATGANLVTAPLVNTTYTAIGSSTNGCVNSGTTSILTTPAPTITVNSSTICAGGSATLSATGLTTYTWNTGATTNTLIANPVTTSIYTISGIGSGCTSVNSKTTSIHVNALPSLTTTASNTLVCFGQPVILNVSGAMSYTWNTGATTSTITDSPTATTTYSVYGIDANSCSQNTSITINVSTCTDIEQLTILNSENIIIFPNPANKILNVESENHIKSIEVFDMVGKLIFKQNYLDNINQTNIDLEYLPSGVYSIIIKNQTNSVRKRFIKE